MNNLLAEFVAEEPLEEGSESYYHISGMHICKIRGGYVILSHNDYRALKDKAKDIGDLEVEICDSLERAIDKIKVILEYANSRGAVDARFIQKRRGSDYKVNSRSDGQEVLEPVIGRSTIEDVVEVYVKDNILYSEERKINKQILATKNIGIRIIRKVKLQVKRRVPFSVSIIGKTKTAFMRVREMLSKQSEANIGSLDTKNGSVLIKYEKKGYTNYFLSEERVKVSESAAIASIELVNDSVATNELIATIGSFNLVKLNQHLFIPVQHGTPLGDKELELGNHLLNKELKAFDTERKAIEYIYGQEKPKDYVESDGEPKFIDSITVQGDSNIHYDIIYHSGKYLAVPSIYTVKLDELVRVNAEVLMSSFRFCAFSDSYDFLKVALSERGDWMDEWPCGNDIVNVYQDQYCIIAKDISSGLVYDLTKISASVGLTSDKKAMISKFIFDQGSILTGKVEPEQRLITRIGEMTIIEYEDYYFAIRNELASEFPNNDYLDNVLTRYDVSLSVIEEYCKGLLTEGT